MQTLTPVSACRHTTTIHVTTTQATQFIDLTDRLERLVADVLRQVLAASIPLRGPGLLVGICGLSIRQSEPAVNVREEHGDIRRVRVHH